MLADAERVDMACVTTWMAVLASVVVWLFSVAGATVDAMSAADCADRVDFAKILWIDEWICRSTTSTGVQELVGKVLEFSRNDVVDRTLGCPANGIFWVLY